MSRFLDWIDTVKLPVWQGIAVAVIILLLIFGRDILKGYREWRKWQSIRKLKKEAKQWRDLSGKK